MLFLFLFIITSIIISRYLDKKKMKVASISYTIMFIVILTYFMLISDFNTLANKIGVEKYTFLKEALIGKYYINVFLIVEIIIVLLFAAAIIISIHKVKEEIDKIVNKGNEKIELIKIIIKKEIIRIKESVERKRIYINYCKFRS